MSKNMRPLSSMWRSLRHRNYRLYLIGQLVSLCGTWMQQIAQGWLVYRLTGSAAMLGLVSFANQIPVFLLSPIAGVVVDRFPRRRIVLVSQVLALCLALALALLTMSGAVRVWHIVLLGAFQGMVLAFDMSARLSLVHEIVDPVDLPNAIAINSSIANAARIVGPSLAGIVVAILGEGICFLINALSYVPVLWALLVMKLSPAQSEKKNDRITVLRSLHEGVAYVFATLPIRDLLLLMGIIGFMGMPYMTLMPVFAGDVLRGGPDTLGALMGAAGVGALAGALLLARRGSLWGLGRLIAGTTAAFGGGLMAFSVSRHLGLSLAILVGAGFSWMVLVAASNTVLQALAADEMRGRVMSLFSMMLVGMAPLGSLLAGSLAALIGAPMTLAIDGFFCLVAGLVLGLRLARLREAAIPILVARGIPPRPD